MLNLYSIINNIPLNNSEIKYKQRIPEDFILYTFMGYLFFIFYNVCYLLSNFGRAFSEALTKNRLKIGQVLIFFKHSRGRVPKHFVKFT